MAEILMRSQLNPISYIDLVNNSGSALIYTDLNFLDGIAKYTNSQLFFSVESDGERYLAALPFCLYDGALGPIINSLPFYGSNGGIIKRKSDKQTSSPLLDALFEFAKVNRCISLTLIESPLQPLDPEEHHRFNFFDSRIGLFNYFKPKMNVNDLIKEFQDPRPRNIRKAEKEGVFVVESRSLDSINFLAQTHIENITAIGGLPKTSEFFVNFLKDLSTSKWVILDAVYQDERVASLLLLYNTNAIEYFTPVTVERYRSLQAQSLLIFSGMLFAISQGINIWNWGGTWHSQQGVYDFKRKWGSVESNYTYFCAVMDSSVLERESQELLLLYPNFYVVPFSELKV